MTGTPPDAALLNRFVRFQDEDAFAALVDRHGAMVLGVCRRILGDAIDAEDACQAAFLVLVRKAAALRTPGSLASWLHGTAHRLALRCRRTNARRRCRETRSVQLRPASPPSDLLDELSARELLVILDEELQRLPESERQPLILCLLEGLTQEEAARLLGRTPGSVKGSVERGRARLQARLGRRGIIPLSVFLALEVSRGMAGAKAPALLVGSTVKAAAGFAAGAVQGGAKTAQAVTLAEQWLKVLFWAKVKTAAVLALCLGLVLAGTGRALLPGTGAGPQAATASQQEAGAAEDDPEPLPLHAVARLGSLHFRHGSVVTCLAVSKDGNFVVSGGWDQAVRLWNSAGKPMGVFNGHRTRVQGVAFSPDGKMAASLAEKLCVWDTTQCRELWSFAGVPSGAAAVAFSPTGKFLAVPGPANQIWFLDALTGKELRRLVGPTGATRALTFSADGNSLASAGGDGMIYLWDPTQGTVLRGWRGCPAGVSALIFTPDGQTLASGGEDGVIRLWDPSRGAQRSEFAGRHAAVRSLHCSRDGKLLVSGNGWPATDLSIRLWDLATNKQIHQLPGGGLASCCFSPDGRTLFYSRGDALVRRYDLVRGRVIPLGLGANKSVAFSPDGKYLAIGGDDLYLCTAASGKILHTLKGHPNGVYSVVFSPDGARLVSAGRDGTIRFWTVPSGEERQRLEGHKGQPGGLAWINAIAFSPDGKLLAEAARDSTIRIWDVAAAREIYKYTLPLEAGPWGTRASAYSLTFSPDGATIAAAGPGAGITVLERSSGQWRARRMDGHESFVEGVAFSPDGKTLASAGRDGTVRLWTLGGQQVRQFQEPPGWTVRTQHHQDGRSLAFSPDGRFLACGSWQSASVWDLATGQERRLTGHLGEVGAIAFSPDSRRLATGSFDTTVMLWDLKDPRSSP